MKIPLTVPPVFPDAAPGMNTTESTGLPLQLEPDKDPRGDGWFVTRAGIRFYPLQPREEDILIQDISFALANICRFGGHVRFMSVAEHCCNVSDACPPAYKLLGLLHDAEEAYIGDCVRPLKQQMPNFIEAGNNLWRVIARRFNLPETNPRDILEVKSIDDRALLAERNHLTDPGPHTRNWWWDRNGVEPLDCRIRCWSPEIARREFMSRFQLLTTSNQISQ
jgi:hypothetical protein